MNEELEIEFTKEELLQLSTPHQLRTFLQTLKENYYLTDLTEMVEFFRVERPVFVPIVNAFIKENI